MIWTLFVVFFVLWLLGLGGIFAIGAWLWLFFAIWVISLIWAFAASRRTKVTTNVSPTTRV